MRSESLAESHFRFGSLRACLRTDEPEFRTRFLRIFSDCLEPEGPAPAAPVVLQVAASTPGHDVVAEISLHEGRADPAALTMLFPELRELAPRHDTAGTWTLLARGADPRPAISMCADRVVLDRALPWQMIVTHYFLNHVMRLQPELFFFHGATVAIGDRGVLLGGRKGAGKSTLSLACAARGHGFLGDEIAAVDTRTGRVLPFARAVSIRPGPQAQAVDRYLGETRVDRETLPDGTERMRVPASRIFPQARPRPVSLTHAFFLEGLADQPRATPIEFSLERLPLLAPLHATLASHPAGERAVRFLKLFSAIRCYRLTPGGTPDRTAELIEEITASHRDDIDCDQGGRASRAH